MMKFSNVFILIIIYFLSLEASSSQKWESLAPIPESFTFPVVAVANGKIHIMGGGGANGATNKHFAYDPVTNSWEVKANVPYLAQQPAGTSVNNKIHFFGGGFPNSGSPLNAHHIYDPVSNTWGAAANLTAPRAIHYAVNLNGLLYSLAGQGMTTLCQTYISATNSWSTKNPLPDGQFFYGAHVATEKHIYRFCGGGYTSPHNRVHRYDDVSDSWSALSTFPARIHGFQGAAIGDQIFLAGGYYDFQERAEVYQFDTKTETVGQYPVSLPIGVNYHNMVSLDSCIYVVGGNHAIDPSVKFQLLRLCPYKSTTQQSNGFSQLHFLAYQSGSHINIELPETLLHQQTEIQICTLNGIPVYDLKFKAQLLNTFDLNHLGLANGMYLIQIKSKNATGFDMLSYFQP